MNKDTKHNSITRKRKIWMTLNLLRGLCVCILVFSCKEKTKKVIFEDLKKWNLIYGKYSNKYIDIFYFLLFYKEYRNLLAYRLKKVSAIKYLLLIFLFKPLETLYITTSKIGKGLFIQHGFSTIISAHEIGEDCWINQQVTIGYTNDTDAPTIGNRVKIHAGAIIIGNVIVGDDATVGAGAVVTKDVPAGATVVGVPARVVNIKENYKE